MPHTVSNGLPSNPYLISWEISVASGEVVEVPLEFSVQNIGVVNAIIYTFNFWVDDPNDDCPPSPIATTDWAEENGTITFAVPHTSLAQNIADMWMPPSGFQTTSGAGTNRRVLLTDLIIDLPYYELNPRNVMLSPGVKIIVPNGSTLVLNGVSIFSCDEMNGGIVVKDGGTLFLNGCYISDAEHGVLAENGSTVRIVTSTFENNYIGISAPNTPQNGKKVFFHNLNTNTFNTGINNVLGGLGLKKPHSGMSAVDPQQGFAGMYLQDQIVSMGSQNFTSLANGIISDGSTLDLFSGNTFSSIRPNPNGSPYFLEGFGV
jgi:hypothetical protein